MRLLSLLRISAVSTTRMFSTSPRHSITYILMGGGGLGYCNTAITEGGASEWLNKIHVPYSFQSSQRYQDHDGKVTTKKCVKNAAWEGMEMSSRGETGSRT